MDERREHVDMRHPQPADHSPGGHERRDVHLGGVVLFLGILLVAAIVIHLGVWGFFDFLDRQARASDPEPNPLVKVDPADKKINPQDRLRRLSRTFPEPRLQYDDIADMKALRSVENEKLGLNGEHPYAWVDQNAGVVRIPIDRAMELLAQRGLGGAGNSTASSPPPATGVTPGQNRGEDAMQSVSGSTLSRPNPAGMMDHSANEPQNRQPSKAPTAEELRAREGTVEAGSTGARKKPKAPERGEKPQ